MIVAIPKEIAPGERRVALTPEVAKKLIERKLDVVIESGAGEASWQSDEAFRTVGVRVERSSEALLAGADLVLKVREPMANTRLGRHEVELLKPGAALVAQLSALSCHELVRRLAERKVTAFAMELMPRITRAQSMDVLSAMSSIAGYKAVLLAASELQRYFPMMMTAAGTVSAARVLILGAGVAGLQAIATARRLGAVVEAYDVRPVVKEQVESLGARFIVLEGQGADAQDKGGYAKEQSAEAQARARAQLADHVRKADVVITTALVPGKKAPVLLTAEMLRGMRPGSVVVDLAAEQGGNCELTRGERQVVDGITILGPPNLASEMAFQASQLYARNAGAFLSHLIDKQGQMTVDLNDEITRGALVTRDGEVLHEGVRAAMGAARS